MAKGKYEQWLTKDGKLKLTAWARDGLTMEQIAKNCGCSLSTLKEWRERYPAISAALKKGREVCDIEVENALYKRACGYSYTETTTENSEKNGVTVKKTVKQVIPDVTAQMFWLQNRKKDTWKDKRNCGVSIDPGEEKGGKNVVTVRFEGDCGDVGV